jgi:hypothetical protein
MWTFYRCARNVCITTGAVSRVCCDLSEFCVWFVGLCTCWLHYRSEHPQKEFTLGLSGLTKWFVADSGIIFMHYWKHKVKIGKNLLTVTIRSQDSSVSIVMGYGLASPGLIFGRGKRFFSIPQCPDWLWGPTQPPLQCVLGGKVAKSWSWPLISI